MRAKKCHRKKKEKNTTNCQHDIEIHDFCFDIH